MNGACLKVTMADDIIAVIDDHLISIQSMLSTRYVHFIEDDVQMWKKKLILIAKCIDEMLGC